MSAIVPAPTACTDAEAPPPRIRITISMAIEVLTAEMIFQSAKRAKEMRYIVRLPRVSEKEDHQRGKMDMESMYIATDKLVIVGEELRSVASWGRAAMKTLQ